MTVDSIPSTFTDVTPAEKTKEPQVSSKIVGLQEWAGLIAILWLAGGLRIWHLEQNGTGNPYYAAAVRSMQTSFSNFFFGSFDPVGLVTVDKPPVAIWVQAISAKVFGYHGMSILLPQALMGVASVFITYVLVRRVFGPGPGLLSGLFLAITPVCVAVDRDNLPDPALVLVLLLAAWAISIATETGRLKPLIISTAFVGLGFNIKMLAAFLILPTFYLCYLLAAPIAWWKRVWNLVLASLVLITVTLSWTIAVELTPRNLRPYMGGSTNNSALNLALGYNGLGRVFGGSGNFSPGSGPPPGGPGIQSGGPPAIFQPGGAPGFPPQTGAGHGGAQATQPEPGHENPLSEQPRGPGDSDSTARPADGSFPVGFPGFPPGGPMMGFPGPGGGMQAMFGGAPGILRFTRISMAGQITWLLPLALLGSWIATTKMGRPQPFTRQHISLLLWAGWLGTHWVIFSFAKGIFHDYYTTIMGPAIAALAAIGTFALYYEWREGHGYGYLPMAIVLTACWQACMIGQFPEIRRWLFPVIGIGTLFSVLFLTTSPRQGVPQLKKRWIDIGTFMGLAVILIGPTVWSLTSVIAPGNGVMPAADPSVLTGSPGGMAGMPPFGMNHAESERLAAFLEANHDGERILVAAPSSMEVSSLIIDKGLNAVSMGGFMGADPVLSLGDLMMMVREGQLRFILLGGGPPGGPPGMGGPGTAKSNLELLNWVQESGKKVDRSLWNDEERHGFENSPDQANGNQEAFRKFPGFGESRQLYDCRPEKGLTPPSR